MEIREWRRRPGGKTLEQVIYVMGFLLLLGVLKKQATERSCDFKCTMRERATADLPVSQHENEVESVVA